MIAAREKTQSDVKHATLELVYTRFKAPIAGLIGESTGYVGARIHCGWNYPCATAS
ncbi:hypothetical protein GCM10007053_15690 [Halioglobus pacificus]|uniref:Uncharacterized protein n=1 Tax=Parahalioglobus pacificus TaxID=930806 RepID=A0A918XH24_9GAMM|nr:hypothetical protein GCM10007053_15690 [Halioglobus pacificus]